MSFKPILVVTGDPKSIFFEIFFKSLKKKKYKHPIVLICSQKLLIREMKKYKFKSNLRILNYENLNNYNLNNKAINIINVNYDVKKNGSKKISNENFYIRKSFEIAFDIINRGISYKLINGPISKSKFLRGKFPGITEFLINKFRSNESAMLIYNKKLSVCPVTTHLPIKEVAKNISQKIIIEKAILINYFYKRYFNFKPKIGIVGLNPHCESFDKFNEDEAIIKPAVNFLKKKINITGPFAADTIFLKNNRNKFNVIIGMYHDQVLGPLKTLFEYDAINITLGLPFIRITPDHGPNELMFGKNLSDPQSLINSLTFMDKN